MVDLLGWISLTLEESYPPQVLFAVNGSKWPSHSLFFEARRALSFQRLVEVLSSYSVSPSWQKVQIRSHPATVNSVLSSNILIRTQGTNPSLFAMLHYSQLSLLRLHHFRR